MFAWRNAIFAGIAVTVVGVAYWLLQGHGETMDRTGATMLISLGAAMAFVFIILLRGTREL